MYNLMVIIHNLMRWIVLIFGFIAIIRALWGWIGRKSWMQIDRRLGLIFTISIDVQLLVGLILYFVYSNWALKAILEQGFSYVMGQSNYRFFAIEHGVFMILGVIFAHLGNSLIKKVDDSSRKFKRAFIWFGLAFVVIIAGIPWFRPLFPGF